MPITITDVSFNASTHTVGDASLLGGTSGPLLVSQTADQPTNITGVAITQAFGNQLGFGTLSYNPANQSFGWKAPNAAAFVTVAGVTGGSVAVGGPDGYLVLSINPANLPTAYRTASVGISAPVGSVFPSVTPVMALGGDVQYRCIYFRNNHPTLTAHDVRLYINRAPAPPQMIAIGVDPAGAGDGTDTGVAQTIATPHTAPVDVVWSMPMNAASGINLGSLLPGQGRAIWQRRTVPAMAYGPLMFQSASLGVALVG